MGGRAGGWAAGRADGRKGGWADGQTVGRRDGRSDGLVASQGQLRLACEMSRGCENMNYCIIRFPCKSSLACESWPSFVMPDEKEENIAYLLRRFLVTGYPSHAIPEFNLCTC